MDATERTLKLINEQGKDLDSEIIKDLIDGHASDRNRMINLYERYKGSRDGLPILRRVFEDKNKINRQLPNDYFSEIVDIKAGYFAGEPISYGLDKEAYRIGEQLTVKHEEHGEVIRKFVQRNNLADLDSEAAKLASICGYVGRLCYIDRDGGERVMNTYPWESIFVTDGSINEPQYGMRYYKVEIKPYPNSEWVERWRVEWYDEKNVTFYIENSNGDFVLDESETTNPLSHGFTDVPFIGFPNNEEQQGDAEKVLYLIDAFDRSMSDMNSEVEQFRLAYLAFYGVEVDQEALDNMRQTGAIGFPDKDGKAEFVAKNLMSEPIEAHLNRIENNIYRFSKTPNFTDEAFAGSQSGEARKYKMLPLENKCVVTENKFKKGLQQMFKIISTAWNKRAIPIDYLNIEFTFTRNFPLDLLYEAEVSEKLRGQVSEHTRFTLLSFIPDPDAEQTRMEHEQLVDLDQFGGGDDEPVEES